MGYTEIDVAGPVTLTMLRRDGTELPVDRALLNAPAWGWGIDGDGRAYFDSAGAGIGEHAQMGVDQAGIVFLLDADSARGLTLEPLSAPRLAPAVRRPRRWPAGRLAAPRWRR